MDYRYAFCPLDGSRLTQRCDAEGQPRRVCATCGFTDYGNPKPCVAVLLENQGKILLGRRAVEPAKGLWDILGGFIEAGETAEEAVHREIHEETGLQVTITHYLGSFPDTYGLHKMPTLNLGFVAAPTGGALRSASDVGELRWFALGALPSVWAFAHQEQIIAAFLRLRLSDKASGDWLRNCTRR